MIRSFAIVLIALVLSVTASASQQVAGAPDTERRQDTYAVYSSIFANPDFRDSVYLIDVKTVSLQPQPPSKPSVISSLISDERCFAIPPAYAVAWSEVLNERNTRKDSPGTIETELKTKTPYVLLDAAAVKEFQDAMKKGSPSQNPEFRGGRSLITLGDVYFDQKRTLALTAISTSCGSLCGYGQDLVFEKGAGGSWQARPAWVTCSFLS